MDLQKACYLDHLMADMKEYKTGLLMAQQKVWQWAQMMGHWKVRQKESYLAD